MSVVRSDVKWLIPGMRVKRWGLLTLVGITLLVLGLLLMSHGRAFDLLALCSRGLRFANSAWNLGSSDKELTLWGGLGVAAMGLLVSGVAVKRMILSVDTTLGTAAGPGGLAQKIYRTRILSEGPRIVVLGGGTGLSTMLRGLKEFTENLTAVVTVTDDGGSSGKLIRQLNILPPGDIRNCLVALSDAEQTMTQLFQYRFVIEGAGKERMEGLRDHAFGNLLIAAMAGINDGDFVKAIQSTSRVLNIRGDVLPSTVTHSELCAEMKDGSHIRGETNIAHSPLAIGRVYLEPGEVDPPPEVLEAIRQADLIVLGPGSLYTSVIPPLLVHGIADAVKASRAVRVYICNVMTQKGETDGYTASSHVSALEAHAGCGVVQYVLVNRQMPSYDIKMAYERAGAMPVANDSERIKRLGYRVVEGDFINQTDVVRHDTASLAASIMKLLKQ